MDEWTKSVNIVTLVTTAMMTEAKTTVATNPNTKKYHIPIWWETILLLSFFHRPHKVITVQQ